MSDMSEIPSVPELGGAVGRRASDECRQGQHDLCTDPECLCRHHGRVRGDDVGGDETLMHEFLDGVFEPGGPLVERVRNLCNELRRQRVAANEVTFRLHQDLKRAQNEVQAARALFQRLRAAETGRNEFGAYWNTKALVEALRGFYVVMLELPGRPFPALGGPAEQGLATHVDREQNRHDRW